MPRYAVQHRYFAVDNGQQIGPFEPGSTVELEVDRAEWVNRDSPGTLEPVDQAPVVEEIDEPTDEAVTEEPAAEGPPAAGRPARGPKRRTR